MKEVSNSIISSNYRFAAVEVNSERGYEERQKVDMYQLEYNSDGDHDEVAISPAKERKNQGRPVSVFDYNEYRKLEDKKDRIDLKRDLYRQKKSNDEARIAILEKELNSNSKAKDELWNHINQMKKQLTELKRKITETDKAREREVKDAEQRKREAILKKQGYEVPSIKAAADRSMRKPHMPKRVKVDPSVASPSSLHKSPDKDHSMDELEESDAGLPVMSSIDPHDIPRPF